MVPTALFDSLVIVSVRAAGRYVNLVGEGQGILESLLMEQVLPLFLPEYGGGVLPHYPKFRRPCLSSLASPWEVFFTSFGYFIFLLLWYVTVCMYTGQKELDFQ